MSVWRRRSQQKKKKVKGCIKVSTKKAHKKLGKYITKHNLKIILQTERHTHTHNHIAKNSGCIDVAPATTQLRFTWWLIVANPRAMSGRGRSKCICFDIFIPVYGERCLQWYRSRRCYSMGIMGMNAMQWPWWCYEKRVKKEEEKEESDKGKETIQM